MMADITKLQSKLTQCQVELAKLSNECTEREQRFVAEKLVQEASLCVEKLQADFESASKVAAPLFADDASVLLRSMYLQTIVAALKAHIKVSSATPEELFESITKN